MNQHEVARRFGRPLSARISPEVPGTPPGYFVTVSEVRIPFADQANAESAMTDIDIRVRPVHDAGGEDYRPVIRGEVCRVNPGEL
ncbi:MAG TPA: hypothetical protein VHT94_07375 [Streptosporangiaceae bacterium]|nr:hypothetical protein [Streptosporangiaceae bacterium]